MKGRPGLALAAVLVLAPLAGCGAGKQAETLREGSTIDGQNASTGDLRIRNAFLPYPPGDSWPAGSTIPIYLSLVNISQSRPDTLTAVTSPVGTVTAKSSGGSVVPSPGVNPTTIGKSTPIPLPIGQTVTFGVGSRARLILSGTTTPLRAARFVPITLQFARADTITMSIPVGTGYGPGAPPSGSGSAGPAAPEPSGAASGEPSGAASGGASAPAPGGSASPAPSPAPS